MRKSAHEQKSHKINRQNEVDEIVVSRINRGKSLNRTVTHSSSTNYDARELANSLYSQNDSLGTQLMYALESGTRSDGVIKKITMKNQVYLFYDIALCHYYAGKITAKYKIVWLVDLTNLISQMSDIRQWCDENKDTLLFIVLRKGWLGKVDDFITERINVIDYPKNYPRYAVFDSLSLQLDVPVQNNMCLNGAILVTKDWLKTKNIHEATMIVWKDNNQQTIEIYI